jgi:uncharacterized protein YdeI (YjbR/CyaY-like superfamily)
MPRSDEPRFFASPAEFRAWLEANHGQRTELVVGFYKRGSGKPSMTWSESVDEALCFGWIDGVRRSLDAERYTIRFTPRKPVSIWSNVNIAKVEMLLREGRMRPAGLAAWERRDPERSGIYSFERKTPAEFDPESLRRFKRARGAWAFFQQQPPGYRRLATHYVTSAKRPETRERRLSVLIEHSAKGERLPQTLSAKPKT